MSLGIPAAFCSAAPADALLAVLWASEEPDFRGPGFYFNLLKIALVLIVYLCWINTCAWVNRDAEDLDLPADVWNGVLLGAGALGLLLLWVIPIFLLGLILLLLLYGGASLAYISVRDQRVDPEQRLLSAALLRGLGARLTEITRPRQREGQKEKPKESTFAENHLRPPIRFLGRSFDQQAEDPRRVARAEGSKGYRAALQMVYEAIHKRATDIHLEPGKDEMAVRFRVDGILHAADPFSRAMGEAVVNIFKVLSNLDITERRKPQDGSFSAEVDGRMVDFRVATAGSVVGEKLVMRILDKAQQVISLTQLGMRDKMREQVRQIVTQPHGMFVVCGPTGAGKTTTLYACLGEIDRTQQNVITIENPVEYRLANATQIEVNARAGKTFASELRSILRQDPDIIMIGEIRDKETAEIACQAAQTGHMVFTTLHANDTVTALTRLMDLGVEPFMIASALSAVVGQRLVRTLCDHCKVRYKPNPEILRKANLPADRIKYFYRPPEPGEAGPEPCAHCGGTGYYGRTGIFELLVMSDALRDLLREKPNLGAIKQEAVRGGMRYLYEDGMRQVIEGRTSIQELLRVSR
jgi:type II secretory ATPase GspE/PulE/Tfp pilus assembly ATPase PilB-like protein